MEYLHSDSARDLMHDYGHLPPCINNNSMKWQTALKVYLTPYNPVFVRYSVQYCTYSSSNPIPFHKSFRNPLVSKEAMVQQVGMVKE